MDKQLPMVFVLFNMRLHLFALNSMDLLQQIWVQLLWASTLFLASVKGVSSIAKRNFISSSVGSMFLVMRSDVPNPRLLPLSPVSTSLVASVQSNVGSQ